MKRPQLVLCTHRCSAEARTFESRGLAASAVLLDSKGGGTGKTFDWEIGGEVRSKVPFILAGGLTPCNVEEVTLMPFAFHSFTLALTH